MKKESKDKMDRIDIINHLLVVTDLKRVSINHIFSEIENPHKYVKEKLTGPDAVKAKEYIKENIKNLSELEIIDYITKKTRLNNLSAKVLYDIEFNKRNFKGKARMKRKEDREEILYKGRRRNFFVIDDSKLWRNV